MFLSAIVCCILLLPAAVNAVPVIYSQEGTFPRILEGNELRLYCTNDGGGVRWTRPDGAVNSITNNSTLYIPSVSVADGGLYRCEDTSDASQYASIIVTVEAGWSTASSKHIIGILPIDGAQVSLVVSTTETQSVQFITRNANGFVIANTSVTSGSPTTVSIPQSYVTSAITDRDNGLIVTTVDSSQKISITVTLSNGGAFSAGSYQSLPPWGYNSHVYYMISADGAGGFSSGLIVSTANDTIITIEPSVSITIPADLNPNGTLYTLHANTAFTITLNYLETFLLKSTESLTGSKVISNKPIAVYSGHTCANVPVNSFACDFIGSQLTPVASWGDSFIVSAIGNRNSLYVLKFISSQDNTTICVSCQDGTAHDHTLHEGGIAVQQIASPTACYINSSSPILLAQFGPGLSADFITGDPSMSIIHPTNHYINNVTIPVIVLLSSSMYLSLSVVTVNTFNSSSIKLNGISLESQTWTMVDYNKYIMAGYGLSGISSVNVWSDDPDTRISSMIFGLVSTVGYAYNGQSNLLPYGQVTMPPPLTKFIQVTAVSDVVLALNGTVIVLRCTASGYPTPIDIQWTFNNDSITNDSVKYSVNSESGTLTIANGMINDAGIYKCIAINSFGSSSAAIDVSIQVPLVFLSVPPTNITGVYGGNITLSCTVFGIPLPTVYWTKDGVIVQPSDIWHHQNGQITVNLAIYNVTDSDRGEYTCHANNSLAYNRSTTNLIITKPPRLITSSSAQLIVNESDTFQLSCHFSGLPIPCVSWYHNGVVLQNITDKISIISYHHEISIDNFTLLIHSYSMLTVTNIRKIDEGNYTCRGTNDVPNYVGYIDHFNSTIQVITPPEFIEITAASDVVVALNGTDIVLRCTASGYPTPIDIRWTLNDVFITNDSVKYSVDSESGTLTIANVMINDAGIYKCIAINSFGSSSAPINVTIQVPPVFLSVPPTNITSVIGGNITLSCIVFGIPLPTVNWLFNGMYITAEEIVNIHNNRVTSNLTTNDIIFFGGYYTCQASSDLGVIEYSSYVTITIPPAIDLQSSIRNNTIDQFETLRLSCRYGGLPRPQIVWTLNGVELYNITNKINIDNDYFYNYQTNSTVVSHVEGYSDLTVRNVQKTNEGNYTCKGINGVPNYVGYIDQRTTFISVRILASPKFLTVPPPVVASPIGSNVNLSCTVSGIPLATVYWTKDGVIVQSSDILHHQNGQITVYLAIYNVTDSDRGEYTCHANNSLAYNRSTTNLTITKPPRLITSSSAQLIVNESDTFQLSCHFSGLPIPCVSWYHNGVVLQNITDKISIISYHHEISIDNFTLLIHSYSMLTVTNIRKIDEGNYTCRGTNDVPNYVGYIDHFNSTIQVITPPEFIEITAASDVVVALNGTNIVLRCTASGYPTPIDIRWTFNNDSITNDSVKYSVDSESGTLTIANGMINDAGIYTCIAINSFGSSSAPINVSIQVPPVFLSVPPTNITSVIGGNITLSCTVFGVPLPTVNWLFDGMYITAEEIVNIHNNRVTSILTTNDIIFFGGYYTCQASNDFGVIEYSSYVTITIPPAIDLQSSIQNNTIDQFETLHLSCRYRGLPRPQIVWTLNGVELYNITNKINIDNDYFYNYQTNSTVVSHVEGYSDLTVRNVQKTDEGNYTCKGINGVPNYVGYIDQRTTFISVRILASPKFLTVPPPVVASPIGSNVNLSCTVSGIPLATVYWTKDGVIVQPSDIWHHQNDQITVNLAIYNVTDSDRGEYTCHANNSLAYNRSTTNLIITKPPRLITSSSAQLIINGSDTFQLSCHFSGLPIPCVSWYHNGVVLQNITDKISIISYHYEISNDNFTLLTHSYSMLTVTNIRKIDEGNYTCRGTNDVPNYVGYIDHFNSTIQVITPPEFIEITAESDVVLALNGTDIVLRCTASGYPTPIDIRWTFNNDSITNDSVKYSVDSESGTLTIANGMINDAGIYKCIAINSFGSSSAPINVSIQVPPVFLNVPPTNITGVLGGNITLSCTVFGIPLPTVNWLFNGLPFHYLSAIISVTSIGNQVTSTFSLYLFNIHINDLVGYYTCQASNDLVEYRVVEYSSNVTTTIPAHIVRLQSSIQNNTIDQFETLRLSCRYGGLPRPQIVWTLNGVELYNITNKININNDYYFYNYHIVEGYSNLTVRNVQKTDEGNYTCKGINGVPNYVGYIDQRTTFISVRILASPKFLTVPPPNLASPIGSNVNLSCAVSGIPLPTVYWTKDGVIVQSSDTLHHQNGQITVYLSIYNVTDSDRGEYTCHANNSLAYNRSTTNLTITKPPRLITSLSAQLVVNESDTFQLLCHFSGLPIPRIVWYHNGVVLRNINKISITSYQNETHIHSMLTITNVLKMDEGSYTCRGINDIPNYVGYIDHYNISVTVQVPPTIQSSNEFTALVNNSVTITFNIINAYPPVTSDNILWQFKPLNSDVFSYIQQTEDDNILNQQFTPNRRSLILQRTQLSDRGTYKLIATNEAGTREATVTLDVYVQAVLLNVNGSRITRQRGEDMTIECTADGIPQPTIVWRRNGRLLVETSRLSVQSVEAPGFRPISGIMQITSTLIVRDLRESDSGSYTCRADNDANIGAVLDTPFVLQVTEPPPFNFCANFPCLNNGNCTSLKETFSCNCTTDFTGTTCNERIIQTSPPSIVEDPINTSGKLYSSISLTCIAVGTPAPIISWYKDNKLIINNNTDPAVLVISEMNLNDRGFYHCQAMNTINGVINTVSSSKALVNITDVVQYEANMKLPDDFYDSVNGGNSIISPKDELFDLISRSNNYLAGSGVGSVSNASFFFLEILNPDSINYTAKPDVLPIVVTVVSESPSDEQLRLGVTQQLAVVSQQLTVNISILEVDRFDGCRSNYTIIPSHSGRMELDLTIKWPETNIGGTAVVNCPCGSNATSGDEVRLTARRYCGGDFTNGAVWSVPNQARCDFSDLAREICRLRNLPVVEKVEQLENLTRNASMLGSTEVAASVSVLTTATEQVSGNVTLTTTFLEVIDNILVVDMETLQESQQESNTSAQVLEAIESVVEDIPIVNASEPVIITQRSFAVSVQQVNLANFAENGQTFSVNLGNTSSQLNTDNLMLGETSMPPTGSISLPNNLFNSLVNISNNTRITNAVFTTDSLFLRRDNKFLEVGSVIIAGTVVGAGRVTGLEPPVILNFQISPNFNSSNMSFCTFWDQTLDEGYGNWSTEGCNTTVNNTSVMCECNHLTSFAILLDVSPVFNAPTPVSLVLEAVTYIGLIISIVCLIITIISYLASKKLRTADHGQLLLNLCFALMGLYISFIIAVHGIYSRGFCAFAGALLQYFFLVTFMTMAAEAVNLYMNLVIVLGRKIQHYVMKAVIVCWVVPFFIVLFCFAPSYEYYTSEHFCRAFEAPFYIGTVIPFIVIYIFNWVVFAIIIITLTRKAFKSNVKDVKSEKEKNATTFVKQQLVIVLTLSFLFGLGWGVGLLATEGIYSNQIARDIFAAAFILTTAFHGLFIFIMHCLRSKEIRSLWKRWFFGITRKDFDELTSSTYNRVRRKASRPTSSASTKKTSLQSPSYLVSPGKDNTDFTFSEVEMKDLDDKNTSTLKRNVEKKENQYESVIQVEEGPIIVDTPVTKSFPDIQVEEGPIVMDTLVTKSFPDIQVEEGPIVVDTPVTKSFPDDEEDEKEKLRREEEQAHEAYNKP